ncbi:MAG: SBBP repeat-containing protein [Bacteroidetes bacterium]|nr:SBBP repeat-containing protein [Bacteroidota bacterium]
MKKLFYIFGALLLFSGPVSSQCVNVYNCWIKHFNGTANNADKLYDIKVSSVSGNAYATGETYSSSGANSDFVTIKYNPEGDTLWTRKYNGTGDGKDVAYSLAIDNSENVYVTGESKGASNDGADYLTIKYNSDGVQQWVKRYNGSSANADVSTSICVDASQNIIVTGYAHMGGATGNDFVTIKYNPAGTVMWTKVIDFGSADYANKVISDRFRNVYVVGYSISTSNTGHDFRTVKYDSAGNLKWTRQYDYLAHGHDEANDVAVDNSGNVYVTGKGTGFVGTQFATIKYNSAGDSIWSNIYFYIGSGNIARAIMVDTLGGVYVTGESTGLQSNDDFATIKYDAVSGATLWTKRFNGTANNSDLPTSIVQGKNGKIFVGGGSTGSGTNYDFVIVEYDMATGDSCFVSRFTESSSEKLNAMAINYDKGYIYACGSTTEGAGFTDGMTARYCLLGVLNSVFTIKASIEGFYNPSLNRLNIKDTVKAYLRKNSSPYNLVDSSKVILDSAQLTIKCIFNNSQSGNYYLILRHRNTIETWSRAGGEPFICGTEMNYDYTGSSSKAYGNNQIQVDMSPVVYAVYSGDVNQDGTIDLADGTLIDNDSFNFISGYVPSDLNGDGLVDLADAVFADNNGFNFVGKITP